MGSQGPGRKRTPSKNGLTAEEDALNLIAREAEARLAAKRAARAEAREIRMKELERQQKEVSDDEERMSVGSRSSMRNDDRLERDYLEKGSSRASTISGATLTSLGGTSSRRGSGDTTITADTEASIREIKDSLSEVEGKYRKAMVSNAQLDNEKTNLIYEVDTLKDSLMELEETLFETRRELEEKSKDLEREKHAHSILQFQFNELKETLKQSEDLLTKHGIVLGPDLTTNGETGVEVLEGDQSSQTTSTEIREGSSVLGTHQLKICKDQKDLDEEVQENQLSTRDSLTFTKTSLETNENGDPREEVNQGVEQQSDSKPKEPLSCVDNDELTATRPVSEIKTEQLVLEDSEVKPVVSECDVQTDGPVEKDQQESLLCPNMGSQIIEKEVSVSIESVSDPILDQTDQPSKAVLDEKSKTVEKPAESSQPEKPPQAQGANVSNKKRKKKKKGKQKQKQSEKQESETKTGDKKDKVLNEDNSDPKLESDQEGKHEEHLEKDLSMAVHTEVPADTHDGTKLENDPEESHEEHLENNIYTAVHTVVPADPHDDPKLQTDPKSNHKEHLGNDISTAVQTEVPAESHDDLDPKMETESERNHEENQGNDISLAVHTEVPVNPHDDSDPNLKTDPEGSHEENLGNDTSTVVHTEVPTDSNHDKRNIEMDCVEIININTVPADDSTNTVLKDVVDSAECSNPKTNADCLLSTTGNSVASEVSFSNLTEVMNDQGADLANLAQEIPSKNDALQSRELKSMDAVPGFSETPESISSASDVQSLLVEDNEGNSDAVEEETKHPEETTFPTDHHESAPKCHPSSSVTENVENESEKLVHDQPTVSTDLCLQNTIDVEQKEVTTQIHQDELAEEALLVFRGEVISGDNKIDINIDTAVTETQVILEMGAGVEERLLPETLLTRKDKESLELGSSDHESKVIKSEDEKERSLQDQVMLDIQLPVEEKNILVEQVEEDRKEALAMDQSMLEIQPVRKDVDHLLEKGEEDEKEESVQDHVILDKQPSGENKDILVEHDKEDEKEGPVQDQVVLEVQPTEKKEDMVEKVEDVEKEISVQDQAMPDVQLYGEHDDNSKEKGEADENEGSVQEQVIGDAQLSGEDEGILVDSASVSPVQKEEDEEEEDEGETFDFDDMDLEASSPDPPKQCQDKPNEESVQAADQTDGEPQELVDQKSEAAKNQMDDGQTIENPQTTTDIEAALPEDNQVDQKDIEHTPQQHDTSESKECTLEKHQQASEELRHSEGADLISEIETRNVGQDITSYVVHENQEPKISGEQEVAKPTAGNNKEDDRKESKKGSKKGKGKGKEECKMA